jgi:transaldolase
MKATQLLHNVGQTLWLDNITRDLLNSGTLKRYIDELSVTGLTSNPTISELGPVRSSRHRPRSLAARLQDEGANRSSIPGTS